MDMKEDLDLLSYTSRMALCHGVVEDTQPGQRSLCLSVCLSWTLSKRIWKDLWSLIGCPLQYKDKKNFSLIIFIISWLWGVSLDVLAALCDFVLNLDVRMLFLAGNVYHYLECFSMITFTKQLDNKYSRGFIRRAWHAFANVAKKTNCVCFKFLTLRIQSFRRLVIKNLPVCPV